MASQSELSNESPAPLVSFLGPSASYSHQVYTLYQHGQLAWAFGLTDFDLAQAALQAFESDRYDYKAATTILGTFYKPRLPLLSNTLVFRCLPRCSIWRVSAGRC